MPAGGGDLRALIARLRAVIEAKDAENAHRGLTWLRALGSRQAAAITAILSFFTGVLISDGYSVYQQLLPQLAGVQQSCQHVIRRCHGNPWLPAPAR